MRKFVNPIIFVLILFAFLLSPKTAFGSILFQDDFNDGNDDGWEVINGVWKVISSQYGTIVETLFTLAETQAGDYSWSDYEFEFDLSVITGEDRNIFFRANMERSIYGDGVHVWNWPTGYGLHIISVKVNLMKFIPSSASTIDFANFSFLPGDSHKLKISVIGRNIKVYCDDNLLIDFTDSTDNPFLTGRVALGASTGTVSPSEVWYDNVLVTSIEPEPTPTPTPATVLDPLIVLPGLGGSWNHEEIFLGIDQPQSVWYETPFVNFYDGLVQTLQNAGYVLDENLFIFYYDWLQPISQSAIDLKNYIDTIVSPPPGTDVDLLGHSLGGLVGRAYVQNNPGSHRVDQLITAGSPHKGVPQVYYAWEGADLNQLLGPNERIGAGILLRLKGIGYPNLVQALQNLIPSLSNLLFIEDYLKWNITGVPKPEPSMFQQNNWLKSLGITPELPDVANTLVGTNVATPRWLEITERNKVDQLLGRWEDGKPVGEESASGDRSVLEESARLEGANIISLDGFDHGDLVASASGQEKILEILGFSGTETSEQTKLPFEPALVFAIASPVTLRVTDPLDRKIGAGIDLSEIPNATFSAQEKIILILQAESGKYKIEVFNENDGGQYKLLIGQLTNKQDVWTTYEGEVAPGDSDTYALPFDDSFQTTDTYLAELINAKLRSLFQQIWRQNINPRTKGKLIAMTAKIFGRTAPLPPLLKYNLNNKAIKFTEEAISKTAEAINYAETSNPEILPNLREILDLLGQLHQLLED